MNTILKTELQTVSRGVCTFIISQDAKGYFAHELGELTQWAKIFGTGEQKAHRLNPQVRRGNQYGTFLKPKALPFDKCLALIGKSASTYFRRV